ncbi:MAG: 50S ribosomal protein L7ae-like protein [Tissierellia bacterium]|nr:50S ribosomal protein L7ae-like protein [Tissierellia bacterium]
MTVALKREKKVVGAKQVKRAIEASKAKKVYVAKDAEEKVTADIIKRCEELQIPIVYVDTMAELGSACGIDINAAVAALLI